MTREFFGRSHTRKSKDDPHRYDPGPQTKIDALVRMYTGYSTLAEMCRNRPTLHAPPGVSETEKKHFALLRKAYKRVTGKEAPK